MEIIKENPQTAFRYVACNADRSMHLTTKFLVDIETSRMALIRKEKKGPLGRPFLPRVETVAGKGPFIKDVINFFLGFFFYPLTQPCGDHLFKERKLP